MAQKDLIPMSQRSKEEVKRIASKGGKNSGKARRKKKTMREAAQLVLGLKSPDKIKAELKKLGIKDADAINQTAMLISILNRAMKGDVRAAEFMRDTAGESPQAPQAVKEQEDDPLTKSIFNTLEVNKNAIGKADADIAISKK